MDKYHELRTLQNVRILMLKLKALEEILLKYNPIAHQEFKKQFDQLQYEDQAYLSDIEKQLDNL